VTETAASTEAVVEPTSEPVEEASAQTVEPTAPTAEPEAATQASVEPVAEPVVEPVVEPVAVAVVEPVAVAVAEPVAEPVTEPVAEEAVAEAEAAPEPEPAVVKYRFKSYQTTVLFDFDKSNLDADDRGSLQQLAMASNKGDIVRVHLTGHADSRGTHAYNMSLSERRIQAVISFLAELNIMATSLFAKGETDPVLVDGKEDFDLSRRVQIDLKTRSK
jgi:outer membrane protein OmpA-like peptidoglycan-associated protein